MTNGDFTTDDSSKPDYHLHARRIRIYPDNRVIFVGSTLYIGTTPVFYFPYFYQSLDQQSGYQVTPGYSSIFGAYLLTGVTFPITDKLTGTARLDYRTSRGPGFGLNLEYKPNRRVRQPALRSRARPLRQRRRSLRARPRRRAELLAAQRRHEPPSAPTSDNPFANGDEFELSGRRALAPDPARDEDIQFLSYFTHDDHTTSTAPRCRRLPIDETATASR